MVRDVERRQIVIYGVRVSDAVDPRDGYAANGIFVIVVSYFSKKTKAFVSNVRRGEKEFVEFRDE
jgi:hypothetical protein